MNRGVVKPQRPAHHDFDDQHVIGDDHRQAAGAAARILLPKSYVGDENSLIQ